MTTIEKIGVVQIAFCIGGLISFFILDINITNIIISHITLTMGYLYGLYDAERKH